MDLRLKENKMIEMRWLETQTGKTLMNEHGYYYPETKQVLQYRNQTESSWTEWMEVPVVESK